MHPNLHRLLDPRSIAIVGANDKGNSGARCLRKAIELGFSGPIYPVNPNYESLQDLRCYPSLAALPEVPDSVVVSVPTLGAMRVLAEGEAKGVPAMTFFSSGFADAGTSEGLRRHEEMLAVAQRTGMAISGPNCMGVASLRRRFDTSFVSAPGPIKAGSISIASQSGGLINAFMEVAYARGVGFNYLISAGNQAVLNMADYLDWLAEDVETAVILCVLEGVPDGRAFRAALARATRLKPVVVAKLGRTEAGARATLAHTGSLAHKDEVFAAVCAQAGAIAVRTLDEALEAAAMFEAVPLPRGDNLVILSSSGGATVLATDLAADLGLRFPPIGDATNAQLQDILESKRPFINPFDVGAMPLLAKGNNMTRTLDALLGDPAVDMVGIVVVVPRDIHPKRRELFDQIEETTARYDKPVVVVPEMTVHGRDLPPKVGTYLAGNLSDGLVAIRGLIDYAGQRRRWAAEPEGASEGASIRLEPAGGRTVMTEYESKRVLAAAGFPVTREELTGTAEEAAAAARKIGFPVALKVQSPDLMHKTDVGGLALGLADEAEVRAAHWRLVAAAKAAVPSARIDGVLVQEMVLGGTEFLLGMHRDATFGPVVVLSPGGIFVEVFENAAELRLPPFGMREAEGMIRRSAAAEKLLGGVRGSPVGDRAALARLIADFAAWVSRLGESVVAIDLNPVAVLPEGRGVRILDAAVEFARPPAT